MTICSSTEISLELSNTFFTEQQTNEPLCSL